MTDRPSFPRWATLLVISIVLAAVLVAVVVLVSGGHTPMRHGDETPPPSVVHVPPSGAHD